MATLEERVAYLEGKVGDVARLDADVRDLRDAIAHLDQKVDRFRDELSGRIDALDRKFDTRINALDKKVDRLYLFVLGTLAASIGTLIGVITLLVRLPR